MGNLNGTELRRIERQHADGIKSRAVVDIFKAKGHRFSEATLRKYVQLGLLPKSRRVGIRGRHRGSSGLYPVGIVRLVNDIKLALDAGGTLEEVRLGVVGLSSEVAVLRKAFEQVLERFGEAVDTVEEGARCVALRRLVEQNRKGFAQRFKDLDKVAVRIGRRGA